MSRFRTFVIPPLDLEWRDVCSKCGRTFSGTPSSTCVLCYDDQIERELRVPERPLPPRQKPSEAELEAEPLDDC